MRYTVVWLPTAEARLMRLWTQASDRQAVADAADLIDIALANDPETKGTQVGKLFLRKNAPLAVLYHVDPGDRMVRVFHVTRI
jgi:hypothetical protein